MKLHLRHGGRYDVLAHGRVYERMTFHKTALVFTAGSKRFTVDDIERIAECQEQPYVKRRAKRSHWHNIDDAVLGRAA